jgi:hypothetical protein
VKHLNTKNHHPVKTAVDVEEDIAEANNERIGIPRRKRTINIF